MTKLPSVWTRRTFIARSSLAGAAIWSGACADEPAPPAEVDLGMDQAPDLTPDVEEMGDADMPDAAPALVPVNKPPFVQFMGQGRARLRLETPDPAPLTLRLEGAGQARDIACQAQTSFLAYAWPPNPFLVMRTDHPDVSGDATLHEAIIEGLVAGERYQWSIALSETHVLTGSFRAPPARGQAFRLGWISDTMQPNATPTALQLAAQSPDVVIHGGDLQYMTNPFDTWNGFFHAMAPVNAQAALHVCVGNHEYEEQDEYDVHFVRLFTGQGDPGAQVDYHAFTYGSARFILINSETDMDDPESAQHQWLLTQLDVARAASQIIIVAFHRPYFTFSRSRPSFATRDIMHPIFVQAGVRVVFTGHNHCYERFEVDGVHYVMDGGGGAGKYDPNHNRMSILDASPTDEALRQNFTMEHGVSVLDLGADGSLSLTRVNIDGAVFEQVTLT